MKIDKHKVAWMVKYERKLLELKPKLAGKIDWDTANHQFNQGKLPEETAILNASGFGGGKQIA